MISRFFAAAFITALLPVAVPSPSQAPAGHSAVEMSGVKPAMKLQVPLEGFFTPLNGKLDMRATEVEIAPGGAIKDHYHFGPGIRSLLAGELSLHFSNTNKDQVVHAGDTPIGIATCWEVSFDRALQHSVRNGAQLLAVPANNANFNQTMSEQQLAFSKLRAVELDRYTLVASNVGISAVVTPDGRELQRTQFFTPAYLDKQVRLKTSMTPAAKWGPIVQGALVVAAVAVLLVAILHNGWLTELNRRLSALAKNFGQARHKPDDDPPGDDVVADGPPVDEVADNAGLEEHGRHAARDRVQRQEKGDL